MDLKRSQRHLKALSLAVLAVLVGGACIDSEEGGGDGGGFDAGTDSDAFDGNELDARGEAEADSSELDSVGDAAADRGERDGTVDVVNDDGDSGVVPPLACESYAAPTAGGDLPVEVTEASGLVVSRFDPDVLWINNDSGDGPSLYAVNALTGELVATLTLTGITARDWEDISRGPCGPDDNEQSCLFIGDIGDNNLVRDAVQIYRIEEPDPWAGDVLTEDFATMIASYPGGSRNAEALVVDSDEQVWVLTKDNDGSFEVMGGRFQETDVEMETYGVQRLMGDTGTVTAADYNPNANRLLIRTYGSAIEYRFPDGIGLDDLSAAEQLLVPSQAEIQGESIGYALGVGYWHVSEGNQPPIWFVGCE